jgi:hypothetical protein
VSIHKMSDGVFEVRWREGGRNKSLWVHGSFELARKVERKKMSVRDENRHLDVLREGLVHAELGAEHLALMRDGRIDSGGFDILFHRIAVNPVDLPTVEVLGKNAGDQTLADASFAL